jgi:predicted dehydrogenase
MRIGIVGCGLIGKRRATVAREAGDSVVIVADVDTARARQVAAECNSEWSSDWHDVVLRNDVDAVVVATVNKFLAPVTIAAAEQGKHILCEKPLGRNPAESQQMVAAARATDVALKTGFNHRHHPAIWKARELCAQGAIGEPMFARAVYGHGGRPGYDKEWRGDPDLAGGGEMLDQGVHVIDLCRWFLGEMTEVMGIAARWHWDIAPLEDNGFAILRTAEERVASLHTSWTQWKNRFSFEVFGRDGYVAVEGLGGSYGLERLTWGRRKSEGGAPDLQVFEFDHADISWRDEWAEFTTAIRERRAPLADGNDGWQAVRIVHAIYESSQTGRVVHLAVH